MKEITLFEDAWNDIYFLFPEMTSDFRWFADVDLERPF
jgi:hypothetical protein